MSREWIDPYIEQLGKSGIRVTQDDPVFLTVGIFEKMMEANVIVLDKRLNEYSNQLAAAQKALIKREETTYNAVADARMSVFLDACSRLNTRLDGLSRDSAGRPVEAPSKQLAQMRLYFLVSSVAGPLLGGLTVFLVLRVFFHG